MDISLSLIRQSFNRAADSYDLSAQVQNWSALQLGEKVPLSQKARILDLGCGTGNLVPFIRQSAPSFYLGIDLSEKMLVKARKKFPDNSPFFFLCSDIASFLKTCTYHFDYIISNASMQWLTLDKRLLENLARVLKPNGQVLFTYFPPTNFQRFKTVLETIENKKVPLICDNFIPADVLQKRFSAFFKKCYREQWTHVIYYENMRELLQSIKKTGISPTSTPRIHFSRKKLQLIEEEFKAQFGTLSLPYTIEYMHFKEKVSI